MLTSKKVWTIYNNLIKNFDNEFNILLNINEENLKKVADEKLVKIIIKNREDKLKIIPGYDGQYGKVVLQDSKNIN
jgi:PHP family Zn ribbon phosphoesterase